MNIQQIELKKECLRGTYFFLKRPKWNEDDGLVNKRNASRVDSIKEGMPGVHFEHIILDDLVTGY